MFQVQAPKCDSFPFFFQQSKGKYPKTIDTKTDLCSAKFQVSAKLYHVLVLKHNLRCILMCDPPAPRTKIKAVHLKSNRYETLN